MNVKKRALIVLTNLLIPALASAQDTGEAAGDADSAGATPVINVAAPSGGGASAGGGDDAVGKFSGYSGGDLIISDTNPALYGEGSGTAKIPRYYTVKDGDSLWKLCDFYYGDPWAWPQLWANNKTVTNPHWIYPGDRIKMMGAYMAKHSVLSQRGREKEEKVTLLTRSKRYAQRAVQLRQQAYIEDNELLKAGEIMGSREEKEMLSRFDEMYVQGKKDFKARVGKLYSVYRVERELRNHAGNRIGYLVRILGAARVKRVPKEKAATAIILEAYDSIERGDLLGPLRRHYRPLPLQPAETDLEAYIIANLDDTDMVGTDKVVFIDAGKSHGVRMGNRFLVVRRGDGFATMVQEEVDAEELKKYPDETVAEISVLDVRDEVSVGLITRTIKEVRDGDFVRLRRGY